MAIRGNQKMFTFEKKSLIEAVIKEEATQEGRSESFTAEQYLLDGMLTPNRNIQHILSELYLGQVTLARSAEWLFQCFADDYTKTTWTKSNLKIVSWARDQAVGAAMKLDQPEWHGGYDPMYFLSQIDSIVERCKRKGVDSYESQQAGEIAQEIYTQYKNDMKLIGLMPAYSLICNAWDYIFDISSTYKLLMELAKLQEHYRDSAEERYSLRKAILIASEYWIPGGGA